MKHLQMGIGMVFRKIVSGLFIVTPLFVVTPVLAGTFTVPDELSLLFLNGEKIPSSFFRHSTSIEIEGGANNIIVKYEDVISGEISDDHTVFKSLPFALNFFAEANRDYQAIMTLPRNDEEAKKFVIKPVVSLTDSDNNTVALEIEYQRSEKEEQLNSLFRPAVKTPDELISSAKTSQPSVADSSNRVGAKASVKQSVAVSKKPKIGQPQALDMLHYWWQRASSAQKREFKKMADSEG